MRLTEKEKESLERYTKDHKTTVQELLRDRIKEIITTKQKQIRKNDPYHKQIRKIKKQ